MRPMPRRACQKQTTSPCKGEVAIHWVCAKACCLRDRLYRISDQNLIQTDLRPLSNVAVAGAVAV